MRSKKRQQQSIYIVTETEIDEVDINGDYTGDKVKSYTLSKIINASVSETATLPTETNIGVVPNYERFITLENDESLEEGTKIFVDRVPTIVNNVITNTPDYIITQQIKTQKGLVFRYGIKKCL